MEMLHIFLALMILLGVTRIFGGLAQRLGQPVLVGELVAGVALGVAVTAAPGLHELLKAPAITLVSELGVFFLILCVGVEMRPQELVAHTRDALMVAVGGMVVPLACGLALMWWVLPPSELRLAQALAVGVALATTAVPVTARILMDAGLLHDRVGQTIVSAAIFDDVLGLVLLSILTALIETGEIPSAAGVAILLGRVGVFFAVAGVVNGWLLPRLSRRLGWKVSIDDDLHTLLMVSFGYAVLAELLGMHFILGPFMVGLFYRQGQRPESYEEVKSAIGHFSGAFLAPVFFASIGLQLDLSALSAVPGFLAALIALAFFGKLVGASLPARLSGLSRLESLAVGVGMSGRGVVVLIVASIAFRAGLMPTDSPEPVVANLFSALVITAIVTTIATPVLLRLLLPGIQAERAQSLREDPLPPADTLRRG